MIHQPDDMETVGCDAGMWEVLAYDGAIDGRQIHTNHPDQVFAFELAELAFEPSFAAAEHHVADFVVLQIAESRGIAVPAAEEVFVNAGNLRTQGAGAFAGELPRMSAEPALNSGARNLFPPRQAAAADAVKVPPANAAAERSP